MSRYIYEGGTAFPSSDAQTGGLSVRDYFAAAALQGLIAAGADRHRDDDEVAAEAFAFADAMLEARGDGE